MTAPTAGCTVGHFCPIGTITPYNCPAGTYTTATNTSNNKITDCIPCTNGSYCPEASSSTPAANCPAGYYCPLGTRYSNEFPCPSGYKSTSTGLTSSASCTSTQCPAGYYCPSGTGTNEISCPIGHICPTGSSLPTPTSSGKKQTSQLLTVELAFIVQQD